MSCISSLAEGGQLSPLQEPVFVKLEFLFPSRITCKIASILQIPVQIRLLKILGEAFTYHTQRTHHNNTGKYLHFSHLKYNIVSALKNRFSVAFSCGVS